jgi:hypothetical protein
MIKPKTRTERKSYWSSLSDTELLEVDLTIDNPDALENMVFSLPQGNEESYVEHKYDLRGTDRDKMRCIHCNQPHLAGYVMNKGGKRFLVGHICGAHIYGEDFDDYTSDYDDAVERHETLRRVREVRAVIEPFSAWLKDLSESKSFSLYQKMQDQFDTRMTWLAGQLKWHTNNGGGTLEGHKLPKTFFDGFTDPYGEFVAIAPAIMSAALLLVGKIEISKDTRTTFGRLQAQLSRLELVIKQLAEPVEFFEPAALANVCKWATENDNHNKRRYKAEPVTLTCERDRETVSVKLHKNYTIPSLEPLQKFRAALAGLKLE